MNDHGPRTPRRRAFLVGAPAVGISAVASSLAVTEPAAAAGETPLTTAQLGAANGVAPLDEAKKLPVANVPTDDGHAPASVRSLYIRARDRAITSSVSSDQSTAVQTAVNEAATAGARLVFQPGVYRVADIRLPPYAWVAGLGSAHSLAQASANQQTVKFQPADKSKSVFRIGGEGSKGDHAIRLEDFTIEAKSEAPFIHQHSGFEVTMSNLFLYASDPAPALVIDAASNCRYIDIQIQGCGSQDWPALMFSSGGHPWGPADGQMSNTNDFERLRVERCVGSAMSIGLGDNWNDSFAEFTRLITPHFERKASDTSTPLLRIGNIRSLDILAPMFYGGKGGAVSHEQSTDTSTLHRGRGDGDWGGISLLGGTVIGNAAGSGTGSTQGVRLVNGNGFYSAGTKFIRCDTAVRIEKEYGPDVSVDPALAQFGLLSGVGADGNSRPGRIPVLNDLRGDAWAPTIKHDSPSGAGASGTATGDERSGTITLVPGTSPKAGPHCVLNFKRNRRSSHRTVTLEPLNGAAVDAGAYVNAIWDGAFQISFRSAPSAGTEYKFSYRQID
jgi:hypothetical protein